MTEKKNAKGLYETLVNTENRIEEIKREKKSLVNEMSVLTRLVESTRGKLKTMAKEEPIIIEGELANVRICRKKNIKEVIIPDIEAVPEEFLRIKKEPIKAAIRKHIQISDRINWASLEDQEDTLDIRSIKK